MNILFIHQNFPGQFKHLAPALVKQGHQILAFIMQQNPPNEWRGVQIISYFPRRGSTPNIHPWLIDFETKTIRAEAIFHQSQKLKQSGFNPDIIISNPGWGESLFVKDVWPQAKLAIYCEFFYHASGYDTNFDPEFSSSDETEVCRIRWKNLNHRLHFDIADGGLAPTQWQANSFPESFRSKLTVIHDGIDTNILRPNADASLTLNNQITLTRKEEIITFVNRNLEPYRGYHSFMRSLPEILTKRPQAKVLVVGGNGVSYGAKPTGGRSWRDIFMDEIKGKLTEDQLNQIYFLGTIPYNQFINLLQISTVHVYLSYPFVLSWSLLESMACGCAIAASATDPVREVITDGETGKLVDFFNYQDIAETICELLENLEERQRLGNNARELVKQKYDLQKICLPRQLQWVEELVG
jgi:glycosyltransferase involved in cell wall biosynthesis